MAASVSPIVQGAITGSPSQSDEILEFIVLADVRPMIERFLEARRRVPIAGCAPTRSESRLVSEMEYL